MLEGVSQQGDNLVPFDENVDTSILGTRWNQAHDSFQFLFKHNHQFNVVTKRSILSQLSSFFDPLGLIGPVIVVAKLILQDLWQLGIDWDESVPQDVHTKWSQLQSQFAVLTELQIPRCAGIFAGPGLTQIHGFCDASQRAYGACVYIRTEDSQQNYHSNLICSKSRVAPLKATSLFRLELSAALLLSRLIGKIKLSLELTDTKIFL